MPFLLEELDILQELSHYKSVLIIPCRFCPAASTAVKNREPYFDFFRGFLKTPSYEQLIETMKSNLDKKGIKTGVVNSISPHNFVMCMWTDNQRKKLLERAKNYEALVVLGCEAAVNTIADIVKATFCQVFHGMKTKGLMSIKPKVHLPARISLELISITPTTFPNPNESEISFKSTARVEN